ncbi:MAG: PilT/PilU family type 4a pilus ATPase [Patescibacteria group bacterium]
MTLTEILNIAVEKRASDIHLVVDSPIMFRIDGQLLPIENGQNLKPEEVEKIVFETLNPQQKEKLLTDKELELSLGKNGETRFRTNIYFEKNNLAVASRIIRPDLPSMEELNMPEKAYDFSRLDNGLVLLTGSAGSGKSTSLAAMISLINQERACHIITLEDPIEFVFKPVKSIICQRQLYTDMSSFAEGLKHIVRQDSNIIMVGEMRDLETIAAAITLAETGHLVLATLHTQSAAQAIDRMIDVFPFSQQQQIRSQLSLTLKGVIAQRLLPKIGGGRVAAREVLVNTPGIGNLIRENKLAHIQNMIQTGSDEGMFTLDQSLKELVRENLIDAEVAKLHMSNSLMA